MKLTEPERLAIAKFRLSDNTLRNNLNKTLKDIPKHHGGEPLGEFERSEALTAIWKISEKALEVKL